MEQIDTIEIEMPYIHKKGTKLLNQTERQREETERDREIQRETERDRERQRETERDIATVMGDCSLRQKLKIKGEERKR